jgi:hypothetical protein
MRSQHRIWRLMPSLAASVQIKIRSGRAEVRRHAAINEPYMEIGFWQMMKKRGGWLCALFLSEMLTASAMQGYEGELEKAIVLTLFIPPDHELGRQFRIRKPHPF